MDIMRRNFLSWSLMSVKGLIVLSERPIEVKIIVIKLVNICVK